MSTLLDLTACLKVPVLLPSYQFSYVQLQFTGYMYINCVNSVLENRHKGDAVLSIMSQFMDQERMRLVMDGQTDG